MREGRRVRAPGLPAAVPRISYRVGNSPAVLASLWASRGSSQGEPKVYLNHLLVCFG